MTDELPEIYALTSVEQIRAIADDLRQRIIRELFPDPRTVTQVADVLGLAPAKVHYHVRELERVGLVRQVFTREKGGILEKYFQPVARGFHVDASLLQGTPTEDYIQLGTHILGEVRSRFVNALSRSVERPQEEDFLTLQMNHLWITHEEFEALMREVAGLQHRYGQRRGIEGEHEVNFTVVSNEVGPIGELTSAIDGIPLSEVEDVAAVQLAAADPAVPAPKKSWVVGATQWTAGDLRDVVARGETLDITVIGVCRFSDDVTPELADAAISHFQVRGKLVAPPAVQSVLERIGKEATSQPT